LDLASGGSCLSSGWRRVGSGRWGAIGIECGCCLLLSLAVSCCLSVSLGVAAAVTLVLLFVVVKCSDPRVRYRGYPSINLFFTVHLHSAFPITPTVRSFQPCLIPSYPLSCLTPSLISQLSIVPH
jgi:hypothetical protein